MITGPDVGMAVPVHVVKEFLRQAGLNDPIAATEPKATSKYV
ncbi:MAG TPA: hypothetical protein VF478_12735 [Anaerolineae bacterium]